MGDRDPIPHLDLYAELEVDPDASLESIEAAYRARMKRSHPDLAGPAGLERSKRLNLARGWLTDPGRRARYDASRRARTATRENGSPNRPATGSPRTTPAPSVVRRPRQPAARSRRRRRPSMAIAQAMAVIAVIGALVLAGIIVGLEDARRTTAPATASPTPIPTLSPPGEPAPRATPTPVPTAVPTPRPTAVPTPTATAALSPAGSTGSADLRFSGDYVEHYVAALGPASSCTVVGQPGEAPATPHGFHLTSGSGSPAAWSLELDDTTGSWTMGMSFDDPARDLYWLAGVDTGYVSPSATGYTFDVRMTGATASIRIEGTVVCGAGGG